VQLRKKSDKSGFVKLYSIKRVFMKKTAFLLSSLACFTLIPELLLSLPQGQSVVSGDVSIVQPDSKTMRVEASHGSIIDYSSFNIRKGEKVQFVQPSSSSAVLNRVKGKNPSKIMGKIESNGKVILVNSKGLYFGPESAVHVGSLIASSLEIANEDFIRENYSFFLKNKENLAEIRNDGVLTAASGGAVVLMSPIIRNHGVIQATAGKVVLAAGEHVTLDFQGDRLLNFVVEGELEGAVLEHLGSIQAEGGLVSMRLPAAKKAIQEIVNREGLERGEVFVEENGEIKLVSSSYILAKQLELEAGKLQVEGKIDASSVDGLGGNVRLTGTAISLAGAEVDVSGKTGGGEVLIGGEFQGQGSTPYASKVSMDNSSKIVADAKENGNGGTVVLWSTDETIFDGYISAKGGAFGGNGGCIESSSQDVLAIQEGRVDASALKGKMGEWLLDPVTLTVAAGASPNPSLCAGGTVGNITINNTLAAIILCADLVSVNAPISMNNLGASILFKAPVGDIGVLQFNTPTLQTNGGAIVVNNLVTKLTNDLLIDTTNGDATISGANVSFTTIDSDSTPRALTIKTGTSGNLTVGNIGAASPLSQVELLGNSQAQIASIFTDNGSITVIPSATIATSVTLSSQPSSGGSGAPIITNTIDGSYAGSDSLIVIAGNGEVTLGQIGLNIPLGNVEILSASSVSLSDILTQGGNITILPEMVLEKVGAPTTRFKTFSDFDPSASGSVYITSVQSSVSDSQGLTISAGQAGSVQIGVIGAVDASVAAVVIDSNQDLSLGPVYANSLTIQGGGGNVTFNGAVDLSGPIGLSVSAGNIYLGAPITSTVISLYSLSSILNESSTAYTLTITSTSPTRILSLDAASGVVGTLVSPIEVYTPGIVLGGGTEVNIAGTYSALDYIPGNTPCLVTFRGNTYNCTVAPAIIFQLLPKNLFRNFFFSSNLLGIGPLSSEINPPTQNSAFRPIRLRPNRLPPIISPPEQTWNFDPNELFSFQIL
jgi:filamentous hemagglutinin family protein